MQRTNIYLEQAQLTALKHLAAQEGQSVAALVRTAIQTFLQAELPNKDQWNSRFESLLNKVHQRLPADVSDSEIEADITAARKEVKQKHRAHRH